ncbi:MAG: hypothetical protein EOP06_09025 [Proteobacteria bacterium]|nr:MAG: hypothetical protein EOP06_09025 [Pseudomonadota bacterium]
MMIHKTHNWKDVATLLLQFSVSAATLLAIAVTALWLLSSLVGKDNFTSLTVLVSVIGAVIALSSYRTNTNEKFQAKARSLAFASQMATEAVKLLWRKIPEGYSGPVEDAFVHNVEDRKKIKAHLDLIAATVASLDPKDMPSVEAMAALVQLKAACITLSEQLCEITEDTIDFDRSVAHILRAQTRLGLERDKLFPTYEIGPVMLQKSVERR